MPRATERPTLANIMSGVEVMPGTKPRLVSYAVARYQRPDGNEAWRQWHTDIVVKAKDGSRLLYSGSWKTPTTKANLSRYGGVRICQDKGEWFVTVGSGAISFYEGLRVDPEGRVSPKSRKTSESAARVAKGKAAAVDKFVKRMAKAKILPRPESGDCFCCQFKMEGSPEHLAKHLDSHVKEGYLHGSLIVRACEAAGWGPLRISWLMDSKPGDSNRRDGCRAMRRYLRLHAYGLPA